MNFKIQPNSHIRTPNASVDKMMIKVLIALIPVVFFATMQFRLQFVIALVLCIVTICGLEYISNLIMKRENSLTDFSGLLTAVIFALTLPAGIFTSGQYGDSNSYLVGGAIIFASAAFAIIVGKMVFGGLGANIFNPAGIGRIFMLISFGSLLSYFATDVNDYVSTATPLGIMKDGLISGNNDSVLLIEDVYTKYNLFVGTTSGSFGEVSAIAIIIGAIFLIAFQAADWRKIVAGLGTFVLLTFIYTLRVGLPMDFILLQLLSGSILFGMVFMVTDPVTAPITAPGRVLYAIMIGGLTFLIRIFGSYPEGMLFAILIMNMFTPAIDYHRWSSTRFNINWVLTNVITLALFVAIVYIGTR